MNAPKKYETKRLISSKVEHIMKNLNNIEERKQFFFFEGNTNS